MLAELWRYNHVDFKLYFHITAELIPNVTLADSDDEPEDRCTTDFLKFIEDTISRFKQYHFELDNLEEFGSIQIYRITAPDHFTRGTIEFNRYLHPDCYNEFNTAAMEQLKKTSTDSSRFKVEWVLKDVLINNEIFSDYKSAVEYMNKRLKNYIQKNR